jgi:chaperone modulatory protein CbpM
MAKKRENNFLFQPLTGMILDDQARLSLEELAEICGISAEAIIDMIDEGLLEPQGREPGEWRFRCYEVRRVQVARRLQQDLRVNLPGAALIIELLEELEELRRRR